MIVGFSLLLAIMEVVRAQMEEMPGAGIGSGHKLRFSALLIFFFKHYRSIFTKSKMDRQLLRQKFVKESQQ